MRHHGELPGWFKLFARPVKGRRGGRSREWATLSLGLLLLPSHGLALSLSEALRAAETTHVSLQLGQARIERARAARSLAYSVLFPSGSISGTYQRRARQVVRQVGSERVILQRFNALSGAARADIPLLRPADYARIKASRYAYEAAIADAEAARRELWYEVTESYVSAVAAGAVVAAAKQRVVTSRLNARRARRRFETGLAGRNLATRAELETASAELELTRVENALRSARLSLEHLMGRELDGELTMPEAPLLTDVPEPGLVERAYALRPDLRALSARLREADQLAREPWLEFVPMVNGSALYTWTNETGFNGMRANWTLAVTATWVALEGGRRFAQAKQNAAARREVELSLTDLRRGVRQEIQLALTDLASAMKSVDQAKTQHEVAELNRAEVEARFEQGLTDALTVADATEAAYEAEAETARQSLALRIAEVALLRALGDYTEAPR